MNRPSFLLLLAGLAALPCGAQVRPDPAALAPYRPSVTQAPSSDVPVVQIQAPNRAGVSRNQFQQFDVDRRGVVFNNSVGGAGSALAAWVSANPALAGGAARTILAEVTGGSPSQLRGLMEVAGQRAAVVVANPAGLVCEGCGFINASRGTLAAASPVLGEGAQGRVTGWRVGTGTLDVNGNGFTGGGLDHASLIAHAIRVDATVNGAAEVHAVAGARTVEIDAQGRLGAVIPKDRSERPAVALDVSALGGMYAGQITLVGHGHGVGVRNAGQLHTGRGDLVLTATGQLESTGSLIAGGATRLAGDGIHLSGYLSSWGPVSAVSQGSLQVRGSLSSLEDVALSALDGDLDLTGVTLHAGGALSLSASQTLRTDGAWVDGNQVDLDARNFSNRNGLVRQLGGGTLGVRVADQLDNEGGSVQSNGNLQLDLGGDFRPRGEWLAQDDLAIEAAGRVSLDRLLFYGRSARIHANAIDVAPSALVDFPGYLELVANGPEGLHNEGDIQATILSIHAPWVSNLGSLAGYRFSVETDKLFNAGFLGGLDLSIQAGQLDNTGVIEGGRIGIRTGNLYNYRKGRIFGDTVAIAADQIDNIGGGEGAPEISARQSLKLGVRRLSNTEHARITSDQSLAIGGEFAGDIETGAPVTGLAESVLNSSATLHAGTRLEMSAMDVLNTDPHFQTADFSLAPERVQEYQVTPGGPRYRAGTPGVEVRRVGGRDYLFTPDGQVWAYWTAYDYIRYGMETRVTASDPGRISSGGSLQIQANHFRNDKSVFTGNDLFVLANSIEDVREAGQRVVMEAGTATQIWPVWRDGQATNGRRVSFYQTPAVVTPLSLGAADAPADTAPSEARVVNTVSLQP